jgi:hypothetical protein
MSWLCPYCNQIATITENNVASDTFAFDRNNKEGSDLWIKTSVTVCPNSQCREYTIKANLYKTKRTGAYTETVGKPLLSWQLRPLSKAKPFPAYIPPPIIADYEEACLIVSGSAKASATLARRCLQGIIRDFWGIQKARLVDEIKELKPLVVPSTWAAIDAVRSIGNIGAHMEKDINLIVDVDPGEAEMLIRLLETLFREWYIARHNRDQQMNEIIALANTKSAERTGQP